jgi:heme-degrading monooxygenase HmoA
MSFKIIIERKFKESPVPGNLRAIDDIRIKALRQKGYIGGETVVNYEDNREVLVISAWSSVDDWRNWLHSQERAQLETELRPHLEESVKIRAFMPSADFIREAL